MKSQETNKIIATATVAIALSAGVQAILAFKEFRLETSNSWDILLLVVLGLMVIIIASLGFKSWQYLLKK